MANKTQTRKILIKMDTKGDKKVVAGLKRIEGQAKRTASTLGGMRNLFAGYLGLQGVRVLTEWSDSFQLLRDRMSIFTGSTETATQAMTDLQGAAAYTKSSTAGLAESYNRLALSTVDLGISSEAVLGMTTALQQTFRLSGSTIQEATASTIQLSQGLSAGALRGQELRSVMEANAVFTGLLAEEFGVARGQLIKLAETGAITSDRVLKVLADNFDKLNESADKLGITFEQAVVVTLDKVKRAVFDLNDAWGISSAFSKGLIAVAENVDLVKGALVAIAVYAIPAVIRSVMSMSAAISMTPWGAILTGVSLVTGALVALASATDVQLLKWQESWLGMILWFKKTVLGGFRDAVNTIRPYINKIIDFVNIGRVAQGQQAFNLMEAWGVDYASLDATDGKLAEVRDKLYTLQDLQKKGKDPIQMGGDALKKADVSGVNKKIKEMVKLNIAAKAGLDYMAYSARLSTLALKDLQQKFDTGKISLLEYNKQLNKLGSFNADRAATQGVQDYMDSLGTLAEGVAGVVTSAFGHLEDQLVSFVETGKLSFKDLTSSILKDMNRMLVKALIMKPLMSGLLGAIGGASNGSSDVNIQDSLESAHGNAFSGGQVQAFAQGGLVSSPTLFNHSGGTGLMGEAGTEAIMPLTRTSSGDLGVKAEMAGNVTVNVINNSGNEVETKERQGSNGEKMLDVIITQKVQQGLASGSYDKTMEAVYGIQRRGN